MKKKILSIALIAMSLVSFTGIAQNVTESQAVNTEQVEKAKGKKSDRKGDRKDKSFDKKGEKKGKETRKGDRKDKMAKRNPFEGMTLTETQKQQLQQLNENRRAARAEQKIAKKENKMRADSIKRAERRADKKEYLQEVKAIVGPDQYVVFLENFYVNGNGGNQKEMKAHTRDMKQRNRDGKKDMAHKHHKDNRGKNMQGSKS